MDMNSMTNKESIRAEGEMSDSDKLILLADILSHCEEKVPGIILLNWKRWDDSIGVAGMVIALRRVANEKAEAEKYRTTASLWEQAVAAMLSTDTPEKYEALREQYELLKSEP